MLEGLNAIMQRIDVIQKKVKQLSGHRESFSQTLTDQMRQAQSPHANVQDLRASAENMIRGAENRAANQLNSLNHNLSSFGALMGNEGGNLDMAGLASQQMFLNAQTALTAAQRAQEAQQLQDIGNQAARFRPSTYGNTAFDHHIRQASTQFGLPFALIKAVVHQESQFNPHAVSRAGAQGLMQIMPATGRYLGLRNPFDAGENIMAGSAYLREMLDRYNNNLPHALAAYNAGPTAVDNAGGVPNFAETKEYVQRVLSYFGSYS
jgi:soluble lytic murein transglycosylase-like protein